MKKGRTLPRKFYERSDVTRVAQELLGKVLVSEVGAVRCSGMITETEAYAGRRDRACHSYGGRRTKRTEVMYERGGKAYVYLCYGIHHLFNVVSGPKETPEAVLIRAIEPVEGVDTILERRGMEKAGRNWTGGPGKLTQGLAIHSRQHDGMDLTSDETLRIEDRGIVVPEEKVQKGERIGIDYAGPDAALPFRFYLKEKDGKEVLENEIHKQQL